MSESVETSSNDSSVTGADILLESVSKRYPGQERAAVDNLTLQIPAGRTVMLVGPSGCGKTTTLKMINRLIEPTDGRIVIDEEDVTDMNGDELRRRIGYVIQAGGLFPHMTVAANIGLVPKMLKWDKERISSRVDELLELVSLDPAVYRDRYPKELSGGQQQRIGVARALAADPPVLLMDEPFGAVDPITRQRLQDELINIQHELHKTVVCVTHDFDEAVKLGDWIAIFDEGARIVQYDTPERILAEPADDFVADFIGSGAGLKQLTLTRVHEVEPTPAVTARVGDDVRAVLERADQEGVRHVVVLDDRGRPLAWPARERLERLGKVPDERDERLPLVGTGSTLNDALDTMLVSSTGAALVVGPRDRFEGVVDVETVMAAITEARRTKEAEDAPLGHNTDSVPTVSGASAEEGTS